MAPFVAVAVILVILVAAALIADAAARTSAQNRIRTALVSALGLPASDDVTVDVGGGSVLLQALRGHLDAVDVRIPRLAFGDLVGSATAHATGLPLDTAQPISTLDFVYTVKQKQLSVLATDLSGVPLDSITLAPPELVANATLNVLVARIPVGLGLTPSVAQGGLVFTPTTVRVAGQTLTTQQLTASPLLGGVAADLLRQQSFCVAQYLPRAMALRSVTVTGSSLVVTAAGDGAALGGTGFSTKGTCS